MQPFCWLPASTRRSCLSGSATVRSRSRSTPTRTSCPACSRSPQNCFDRLVSSGFGGGQRRPGGRSVTVIRDRAVIAQREPRRSGEPEHALTCNFIWSGSGEIGPLLRAWKSHHPVTALTPAGHDRRRQRPPPGSSRIALGCSHPARTRDDTQARPVPAGTGPGRNNRKTHQEEHPLAPAATPPECQSPVRRVSSPLASALRRPVVPDSLSGRAPRSPGARRPGTAPARRSARRARRVGGGPLARRPRRRP